MISKYVLNDIQTYRERFLSATPFRHVVIDNFFEHDKADQMLNEFPSSDKAIAFEEMGTMIGKNVVENVATISSFYRKVFDYIKSPSFLESISKITDIPNLLFDETMFGGGTHENINGAELTPHIDFNYDANGKLHRRLNLLLYLNKEWDERWGGSIELHSDPRHAEQNEIMSFLPIFNRCMMFETNEYSWHGFPTIRLPENKQHLSRKAFSIYLYTEDRNTDEIAVPHTTIYVPRPLPKHLKPGVTIAHQDLEMIQQLIERRDRLIKFYQERELAISETEQKRIGYLAQLESLIRLPLTGYAVQEGPAKGFWADGWVSTNLQFTVSLNKRISGIHVYGDLPEFGPRDNVITIQIGDLSKVFSVTNAEVFELKTLLHAEAGATLSLSIRAREGICPIKTGMGQDVREFVFRLHHIRLDWKNQVLTPFTWALIVYGCCARGLANCSVLAQLFHCKFLNPLAVSAMFG